MPLAHPLFARLLRKVDASVDSVPTPEAWNKLVGLVSRVFHDADQDRYTVERAIEISSNEMQGLYRELERRTEHELATVRLSEQRHRVLFDANPLPIFVLDVETLRFLAVNEAMVNAYGYTREEFLSMRGSDIKQPQDVADLVHTMQAVRTYGIQHIGVKHVHKDGKLLDMDITIHSITFEGRRAVLGIAIDTTRARRLEEDLRQAQKMEAIGLLAGGVAHDFNNILAVILANAELTLEELGDTNPLTESLLEIRDAATRAAGLTRQLLTFSRKQKRDCRPLALNAVVARIESMLRRIVGEDVAISTAIAPDLGTIEADPGEVEQVVMNLVVNARDAMPRGGRLVIETTNDYVDDASALEIGAAAGRYIVLSVSDTGCGMTDSVRARIFEPFFTTKEVDKGTGLGLATVFGIVKQSGGGITVHSEPEVGTTFRIYWPRIDAVVATLADERFVPPRGCGTVLVVEDDHQLREVLRRCLTSWGYHLLEASNASAALELVRGHVGPIDLMLTDLVMPGLDGRSLSERVLLEKPDMKIVFMSGYTEHVALKNAALGPNDLFVQKPFSAQKLSQALHRAFDPVGRGRDRRATSEHRT